MLFSISDPVDDAGVQDHQESSHNVSQYLLVCRAQSHSINEGSWQFSLETSAGELVLEASDDDMGDLNRLSMMAALRGLEAIDGASSVTLLSNNRYLIRSLTDSLPRWRRNEFVWEHFGRRIDVQHADLWRRIDRALSIHRVEACLISSRVVSLGTQPAATMRDSADEQLRIDQPHVGGPAVGGPSRRRRRGHRPEPLANEPASAETLPADRLRRWLLSSEAGAKLSGGSRRFTAADLMASSG